MLRPSCRSGSSLVACSFWGRKNVFTQPGPKADARVVALFSRAHEIDNLAGQTRVRRVDRIHLRHMTMLRQHDRTRTSARPLAARLLQELELLYETGRVQF